jgi:CDP-glucose 4,6-dehydratase
MRVPDAAFWRDRRVLVTGNTGFKGAWLSLWLDALGAEVHGLADGVPTEPSLHALAGLDASVEQHTADVRDAAAVRDAVERARPDVLFHLAAQPFVRRSFRDPVGTYAMNVMGTVHVCDAVRTAAAPPRAVVVVSSDKCYENREWEWAYREDEPMGGHDPYSSSKGATELVAAAYRSSYFTDPSGPQLATARAGNVIGGGDWGEDRLIPDIMRGALAGAPIEIRRPDAVRPWQHVLSPLCGYLLLAESLHADPQYATPFNFGPADDDARPVGWIVERLAERWPDPLDWRVDPGPHPHEATWLKVDSSRARARLGWAPGWDLAGTIDEIVGWYVALRNEEDVRAFSLGQLERFVASP